MPTYLSHDWGRDWGSLRVRPHRRRRARQLDLGTATRSGLWTPGKIRIKPLAGDNEAASRPEEKLRHQALAATMQAATRPEEKLRHQALAARGPGQRRS